jgi:hypothetical protein
MLTAVLAFALLREVQLRKAMEVLLRRIVNTWRRFHAPKEDDLQACSIRDSDNGAGL